MTSVVSGSMALIATTDAARAETLCQESQLGDACRSRRGSNSAGAVR